MEYDSVIYEVLECYGFLSYLYDLFTMPSLSFFFNMITGSSVLPANISDNFIGRIRFHLHACNKKRNEHPMKNTQHYRALEAMYSIAPINRFYSPRMTVSEGEAEIEIDLKPDFHHTAGAVHGSVYFKLLDDSAFFAASSLESNVFVLTTSFTTYITRPVAEGSIKAIGRVVNRNRSQWIAESVLYNSEEREIARGNGIFVRSKLLLANTPGYSYADA